MDATRRTDEKASSGSFDERDVRALTQYLTVLDDVGRARDADGLYLVVSQSGREYLVDVDQAACECDDYRYRGIECKHVRRVAFATGRRAIPAAAIAELDIDPSIGEHVDGTVRYRARDGTETSERPVESDVETRVETHVETHGEQSWIVRDRERGKGREFDSRDAAESAIDDLSDLGLEVELVAVSNADGGDGGSDSDENVAGDRGEGASDENEGATRSPRSETPALPADPDPDEATLPERTVAEDPLDWLPEAFVDLIDGTPAINRKGFEVLAHFYDVDIETEVQVGPADTEFEYCQVKATATMPNGRRCEALAGAHVDRGDDPTVLLELADTRARKRAVSIATGVGVVAVDELRSQTTPA